MRTVTIEISALETIRAETIRRPDGLETGGILLGRVIKGAAHLHVTVAGDPGPQALHELQRFRRDLAHAQTLADHAWADHQAVWVGEWHTHPLPIGPSTTDVHASGRLAVAGGHDIALLVLALGTRGWSGHALNADPTESIETLKFSVEGTGNDG